MTDNDNKKYKNAKICHICEKSLIVNKNRDAVRDHCHITGKYRGAAHNECNFKLKVSPFLIQIPVVFHNLKGYDSHLIMQEISKIQENDESEKIKGYNMYKRSCISNNTEKYISFNLGNLRFIGSVQFLLSFY